MHIARRLAWLRLAVALFAVLVAAGAALPTYARLAFGFESSAHACHCEARGGHAHCACPVCFPELAASDDDGAAPGEQVKGKCGDDDPGWRTLSQPAVAASSFVVVPPLSRARIEEVLPTPSTQWSGAPDPRPPRHALLSNRAA